MGQRVFKSINLYVACLVLVFGILAANLVFVVPKAEAATFTVNSTGDASDATPGNGSCATAGAVCTLRAAIEEANALAGTDTINFGISGSGVKTITPATPLPTITTPVIIDGTTQTGATCGALTANNPSGHTLTIFIDAQNLASGSILTLSDTADDSTLSGLVLSGLTTTGDAISTSADTTIECNNIGTNVAGTSGNMDPATTYGIDGGSDGVLEISNNLISGNGGSGIQTSASVTITDNVIGLDADSINSIANLGSGVLISDSPADVLIADNVISSNDDDGIQLSTSGAVIRENLIGTNPYDEPRGNGAYGINVLSDSESYLIGGDEAGDANVVSNNSSGGIRLFNTYSAGAFCDGGTTNIDGTVTGNYIGTNASSEVEAGLGNEGPGITVHELVTDEDCGGIFSVYNHQIGGLNDGEANVIAGNAGAGVLIYQNDAGNVHSIAVIGNSIFDNEGLGIDLATDSNDDGEADEDLGPNDLNSFEIASSAVRANSFVNYPEITEATLTDDELSLSYDYDANESDGSVDIAGYQLDFYANTISDTSGYGEGQKHIGTVFVDGDTTDTHTFTGLSGFSGTVNVSATATLLMHEEELSPP